MSGATIDDIALPRSSRLALGALYAALGAFDRDDEDSAHELIEKAFDFLDEIEDEGARNLTLLAGMARHVIRRRIERSEQ